MGPRNSKLGHMIYLQGILPALEPGTHTMGIPHALRPSRSVAVIRFLPFTLSEIQDSVPTVYYSHPISDLYNAIRFYYAM